MVEVKKIPMGVRTLPVKEPKPEPTKHEMIGVALLSGGKRKPSAFHGTKS